MADLTFRSPPRIPLATFARVLDAAHSPATPEASACYTAVTAYGLDPAIALAFFRHESSYGTAGIARQTKNWGNLRKGQGHQAHNLSGWAWYRCWADSVADWAALITGYYIPRGLTTVEKALPVYAPSSDHNNPHAYADAVCASVASWQALDTRTPMIVIGDGTRVRAEATTSSPVLRMLPAGSCVLVDRIEQGQRIFREGGLSSSEWAHISEPVSGYIAAYLLRLP